MAAPIRHHDADPWAELVERVAAELADRGPDLSEVRAALNESGIRRARQSLAAALDGIAEAQETCRECQAVANLARDVHDQAVADAEWELDDRFTVEGNKTWLVTDCHDCQGSGTETTVHGSVIGNPPEREDGPCPGCGGTGRTRKSMTADERKAWKAAEAHKMPAVAEASAALARLDEAVAAARDGMTFADRRFTAAKHDLDAATAELAALSMAMRVRR